MTMIRQHLAQLRASMAHTEGECCNGDCAQGRQCPNRHPADKRADAARDFLGYLAAALFAVACVSAWVFR